MAGRILAVASSSDLPIRFIHPASSLNSSESFVMISAIISFFYQSFLQYPLYVRLLVEEFSSDVRVGNQPPVPMVLQASLGDAEGQADLLRVESLLR